MIFSKILFYINFGFLFIFGICNGLQNVTLVISPNVVQRGRDASLICKYDLEDAPLYSVKWYRGRYEFYRYSPSEQPSNKVFPLPSINVDISKSNASQVVLNRVNFGLSGNLSCEVTTDAPVFGTAVAVKHMMVVDLPTNGPIIKVNKRKYEPGDKLEANCTSSPSKPHAKLSFYVNDIPAKYEETKIEPSPDSLYLSVLKVNMTLLPSHFDDKNNIVKLTCTAVIDNIYHNVTEMRIPYKREPTPEKVMSNGTNGIHKYMTTLSAFNWRILSILLYCVIR